MFLFSFLFLEPCFGRVLWIWVCPSVRTSIFLSQHFSQDWLISFFLLIGWSWGTKISQNWPSGIFEKIVTCPKMGGKSTKWSNWFIYQLLKYFSPDWPIRFFIFCMKLRNHKYSKLTYFFGKVLARPKADQKGPNWPDLCVRSLRHGFFQSIDSLVFFIFWMKLRDHKYSKYSSRSTLIQ